MPRNLIARFQAADPGEPLGQRLADQGRPHPGHRRAAGVPGGKGKRARSLRDEPEQQRRRPGRADDGGQRQPDAVPARHQPVSEEPVHVQSRHRRAPGLICRVEVTDAEGDVPWN